MTDLNGKADVDLINCSVGALKNLLNTVTLSEKAQVVSWGEVSPDYRRDVECLWDTSYTASTHGWVYIQTKNIDDRGRRT